MIYVCSYSSVSHSILVLLSLKNLAYWVRSFQVIMTYQNSIKILEFHDFTISEDNLLLLKNQKLPEGKSSKSTQTYHLTVSRDLEARFGSARHSVEFHWAVIEVFTGLHSHLKTLAGNHILARLLAEFISLRF